MRYWFLLLPVVATFLLMLKIHLPAFLLLELFCKCHLRDKYIFLPELVQSSQYFSPFLSAHETEQGRRQTFKESCPPFLTGRPGGLGPRFKCSKCCNIGWWVEKIARNVKITLFSPQWMAWTTQNGKIRGKEKNREKNLPLQQQTELMIYSFFAAFCPLTLAS